MSSTRSLVGLAVSIAVCFAASGIGGLLTSSSLETWYQQELVRPSWNPPGSVFPVVWGTLFFAMAVAAWDVWRRGRPGYERALAWFVAQLVLNIGWSAAFFALRSPTLALVEIVLFALVLAQTTRLFFAQSRLAGWLLVPYLAWVCFATVLNAAIVSLN